MLIFCHFFREIFGNKNAIKLKIFGKNLGGQEIFFLKLHLEVAEIFSLVEKSVNFAFILIFYFPFRKIKSLNQNTLVSLIAVT